MKTRQDYMANRVSHSDYYAQFVTDEIKEMVAKKIGVERIAQSADEHLNDIPLNQWDQIAMPIAFSVEMKLRTADEGVSLATGVCIAKQAARMIISQ